MACLTRPAPVPPFFPSLLKRERGISGPAETVSGNFGEFRGEETPPGIDPEAPRKDRIGNFGDNPAPAGIDRFTRTGEAPYTRKDGTQTTLAVWEASCVDCGELFEVKTPLPGTNGFAATKAFGRVRCDAHKQQRAKP